ncbi:terminase [bacterium]|nr:terminase [bacterium]
MYQLTTATNKVKVLTKRIRGLQGGTSASKTISALLYLIARAQSDRIPTMTSIVSESFPHLRRGVMRDFLNIMNEHNYYDEERWSRSDYIYTFETGSKIEFFSADQSSKVRGPRRDRLFINEANNISYETFVQLEIRTKDFIMLDWNPVSSFWFHEELLGKRDDVEMIILTYKDNEALDPNIVQSIEARKVNDKWWRVYGEGQVGEIEERIYKDWQIIDKIPFEARLFRRGIDFGYTNDPTAIVDCYEYNGGIIVDEQMYLKGQSNQRIADFLLNLDESQTLIIADSAEPKSIDEIKQHGLNIIGAVKGPDSIKYGIQLIQDKKISITKRSVNGIKEYRNYNWRIDNDGKNIGVPEASDDHFLDAMRYAISSNQPVHQYHAYKPQKMIQKKYRK